MRRSPVVAAPFKPPPLTGYDPPHPPYLCVVHCDDQMIVIDKPSGLLAVPGKDPALWDCVEARAERAFPVGAPDGCAQERPGALIVHRLDMDTSGVMLLARNKRAQRLLNGQFARRIVEKTYLAEVWGGPDADSGVIDAPLKADWPNRPRQMVDSQSGKAALTRWEVVERRPDTTVVRLFPETGRSHQLRVHLAMIGHPIVGDAFYAAGLALAAAPRLALHALSIRWRCPTDGAWREAASAAPF